MWRHLKVTPICFSLSISFPIGIFFSTSLVRIAQDPFMSQTLFIFFTVYDCQCKRFYFIYKLLLVVCCRVEVGHKLHAQIIVNGLLDSGFLGTRLLGMYILCKSIVDARNIFYQLQWQYPSPCNWMIRGFIFMGWF